MLLIFLFLNALKSGPKNLCSDVTLRFQESNFDKHSIQKFGNKGTMIKSFYFSRITGGSKIFEQRGPNIKFMKGRTCD